METKTGILGKVADKVASKLPSKEAVVAAVAATMPAPAQVTKVILLHATTRKADYKALLDNKETAACALYVALARAMDLDTGKAYLPHIAALCAKVHAMVCGSKNSTGIADSNGNATGCMPIKELNTDKGLTGYYGGFVRHAFTGGSKGTRAKAILQSTGDYAGRLASALPTAKVALANLGGLCGVDSKALANLK